METTTVYGILVTISLTWAGWISVTVFQNSIKINRLISVGDQLDGVKNSVNQMNDRLDLFLKTELDTLKRIAERQ